MYEKDYKNMLCEGYFTERQWFSNSLQYYNVIRRTTTLMQYGGLWWVVAVFSIPLAHRSSAISFLTEVVKNASHVPK